MLNQNQEKYQNATVANNVALQPIREFTFKQLSYSFTHTHIGSWLQAIEHNLEILFIKKWHEL